MHSTKFSRNGVTNETHSMMNCPGKTGILAQNTPNWNELVDKNGDQQ